MSFAEFWRLRASCKPLLPHFRSFLRPPSSRAATDKVFYSEGHRLRLPFLEGWVKSYSISSFVWDFFGQHETEIHLVQQSPAVSATGPGFVEDHFSTDVGGREDENVLDDSRALHLLRCCWSDRRWSSGSNASDGERLQIQMKLALQSLPAVWPGSSQAKDQCWSMARALDLWLSCSIYHLFLCIAA